MFLQLRNVNYVAIIRCIIIFTFFIITVHNRKLSRDCLQCDKNKSFSFFWKINRLKPSLPSYFFGTIHAPYTKVWNYIPNKAKSAFRSSHRIIFEIDLMNGNTLLSLIQCQLLPPGIRLSDIIPIDLYHRLQRHMKYVKYKMPLWISEEQKARGLYANNLYNQITFNWERKRPIWVMIMLNSLTENDIKSKGITVLDSYFYQRAKKLKKFIGSVENAAEQCKTLNYLNSSQVLYALNQTLFQHESIRRGMAKSNYTTDDMIRHYNCGDLNEALFNEDSTTIPVLKNHSSVLVNKQEMEIAKNIENYFRIEILLKRNKRMAQRVIELLNSNFTESFFFVFGAGHFLGNDSIIELIKDHGGLEIVHINDTQQKICDKTRMPNKDDLTKTTNNKQTFSSPSFIYPISSEFYNGRLFPLYNGYYPRLSISEILTKHHRNFFFNKLHYLTDEQLWKQTNPQPDQYWLSYIRSDPYAIGQSNYHHNEQRFHSNRPYHRSFLYNKLKSTISPPSMFFSRKNLTNYGIFGNHNQLTHNTKNNNKLASLFSGYGTIHIKDVRSNLSLSSLYNQQQYYFVIYLLLFVWWIN